ncbi:MAG: ABC transporter ATP-binding protein [Synergistaceae bacterium]|jgi:branched-chain amino acid transport system ATP-binding protein|nr:ABC transporter ATP-binding protein [Synergistaceae bacterium]
MKLAVEQLAASYGNIEALHGISLSCEGGEMVAVIGSNGAGKSTALNCICGVVPASGGEVLLDGRDISDEPPHKIAAMGIAQVPEGRRVFPRLTVLENLEMGAYIVRDKNLFAERLEFVHALFPRLAERSRQNAGDLSGGEQQMLAIGRALMRNPKFLLLDEPSLGLAPVVVESIFDIIADLVRSSEVGIILVEQNAAIALSIASRGYVLENGRITLEAPAQELLRDDKVKAAYIGG